MHSLYATLPCYVVTQPNVRTSALAPNYSLEVHSVRPGPEEVDKCAPNKAKLALGVFTATFTRTLIGKGYSSCNTYAPTDQQMMPTSQPPFRLLISKAMTGYRSSSKSTRNNSL